jgi:zinc protease
MMNKISKVLVWSLLFVLMVSCQPAAVKEDSPQKKETATELLPFDSSIRQGQFENGLKYFIKENKKPEARAELRLVINAGSILEDDDQQGLAHLGEHMAFNGTKHFPKNELIHYLEKMGTRFGADLNAYTSFDEVVYMLQVPTDSADVFRNGFQVLEDWAHWVTYEDEEIDKERLVVLEELRLGRGPDARLRDKQFPVIFKDSQYASRLPIGLAEVVENAPHQRLRDFYKEWYRPNLQAVIAVGDFNADSVYALIQKHFAPLGNPKNFRERTVFEVPEHDELLFAIASDPELDNSSVSIYHKHPASTIKTADDHRRYLMESLFSAMIRQRFDEISRQPDAPFLRAYGGKGGFVRTADVAYVSAIVADNGIEIGLDALVTELNRVKEYGFLQSELERNKKSLLRRYERSYQERDKTESRRYASELIRHFLSGEAVSGIEYEYELTKKLLPQIELDEFNNMVDELFREKNRVIVVSVPEKEGVSIPNEADLATVIKQAANKELTAYNEAATDAPLVSNLPLAGAIVEQKSYPSIGVEEWLLSNGVKILYKQTDFKNDQVLFRSFSPGGYSLADDAIINSARLASGFINNSGAGSYDHMSLQKKLAGKIVKADPYISDLYEGMNGSFSPSDAELAFELIFAKMTAPRRDEGAFQSLKAQYVGWLQNKNAKPENVYEDSIQAILSDYSPRRTPLNLEMMETLDLDAMLEFYQDRFADASDFTFIFVGNIMPEQLKDLACRYLGALPSQKRNEMWQDEEIRIPDGIVKKSVRRGIESKGYNRLVFESDLEWDRVNNYNYQAMVKVLQIRLREVLREDMGGTYGVSVFGRLSRYPDPKARLTVHFGTDPDRIPEMTEAVFVRIDSLQNYGFSDVYVQKVVETEKRTLETQLKENDFWLNTLTTAARNGNDLELAFVKEDLWQQLDMETVSKTASKYIDPRRFVEISLYPEQ